MAVENMIKYFLVQAFGSAAFIMSVRLTIVLRSTFYLICYLAVILKLGLAPFHSWYLNIIEAVRLAVLFILSTVQKLIPLYMFMRLGDRGRVNYIVYVLTLSVGISVGSVSLRLKSLLAASSLCNIVWVVVRAQISMGMSLWFFSIYRVNLFLLVLVRAAAGYGTFRRLGNKAEEMSICMFFMFLSLGGVPPFIGFFAKLVVLKALLGVINTIFMLILVLCSAVIVIFYFNFSFSALSSGPSGVNSMRRSDIGLGLTLSLLLSVAPVLGLAGFD